MWQFGASGMAPLTLPGSAGLISSTYTETMNGCLIFVGWKYVMGMKSKLLGKAEMIGILIAPIKKPKQNPERSNDH